jgi:hypothetical protein
MILGKKKRRWPSIFQRSHSFGFEWQKKRKLSYSEWHRKAYKQLLWPWTRSYSEFLPHIPVMGRSHVTHFQDCDSMVWMWPPKFMFWKRNWVPRVTVSRGGTFGRWLGHVRSALGSGSMLVLWKQLCYLQSRFAIKASLVPSLCLVLLPCGAAIRGRCHKNSSR